MHIGTFPKGPAEPAISSSDILALVADSVICADERGRILFVNGAGEQVFGYSASEVIGQQVEILLPPHYREWHAEQLRSFARGSGAASRLMGHQREVCGRRKSGEEFPAEAAVSRHTVDGRTILTVAVRDITERKALEGQRDTIARELDHRVRNLISIFSALVALTARSATTISQFKDSLLERLGTLARTQDALGLGAAQSTSLRELLLAELVQYRSADAANIVIKGPPIPLVPGAAQMLALAFHELATNSVKYGSLSQASGRVTVTFAHTGENDSQISLEWRETGGPVVKPPERQGFGAMLLKQVIEKGFQARLAMDFPPEGLVCTMILPTAKVESQLDEPRSVAGMLPPGEMKQGGTISGGKSSRS